MQTDVDLPDAVEGRSALLPVLQAVQHIERTRCELLQARADDVLTVLPLAQGDVQAA